MIHNVKPFAFQPSKEKKNENANDDYGDKIYQRTV